MDLAPLGISQKLELAVSTGTGGSGATAGRPSLSDLSVTVPLTAAALRVLRPMHRGDPLLSVRVEVCRSSDASGDCTLQIDLTDAFVTGVDYGDSEVGDQATAVLTFAPRVEKITGRSGTAARSVTYDVEDALVTARSGGVPDESASPFLTTLASSGDPTVKLGTASWSHSVTSPVAAVSGGGISSGRVDHDVLTATTGTGPGTADLAARLLDGTTTESVAIAGCGTGCTQSVTMGDVFVTRLVLGSPFLTDKAAFNYGTIAWDRLDDTAHTVFAWDVRANREPV